MADPKNKTEDELDAVSAAYESISAKLEDLRKKQAELEEQVEQTDDSKQLTAKNKSDDDEEAIEEFDAEEETVSVSKTTLKTHPDKPEELEVPPPLPGTEEEPPLPKKQVYQADDPLDEEDPSAVSRQSSAKSKDDDDEAIEEFDAEEEIAEDRRPQTENTIAQQKAADEMQKWEQLNQGKSLSGHDLESADEEPVATKPTFTPLSQDEFQNRIRRPQEEESLVVSSQSSEKDNQEADEVDSLDDLAEETVEPKDPDVFNRINRPTATESLADDWDIRHLKPKHASSFGREDDGEFDTPQREFRRPPVQEENYFDRRNQPLPRKKASLWHLLILLLIGAGVIGATVYFLKYQFNEPAKPTPSPEISTPTPVATPTPTPVPTISDRSGFTVRVLNGTSKTGLAGTILTKLKDAGFKTDRSGNATNSAFEQTIIRVKEGSQSSALVETVTKDLGSDFSPISETTLKSNDKADVEVILGQK